MKNVNKFQIAKVQPQGVAQHLLDFLPISVWRCYKNVAFKIKCILSPDQSYPIVVGALDTISKSFQGCLKAV